MAGKPSPEGFKEVQRQYGRQARLYANAAFYGAGETLETMRELAALGRYRWAADVASGAGYTAFALAPYAQRCIITDLTRQMLLQARQVAASKGAGSTDYVQAPAEALPFNSGSLDLVTCRFAAHHFPSLKNALREVARVLRRGGILLLADTVPAEDDEVARWMDDVERRRDLSHVSNRKPSRWRALIRDQGLGVTHDLMRRVYLEFNDWVERSGTLAPDSEALRRDFVEAPAKIRETFDIHVADGDVHFHWPCLVIRAVKE